MMVDVPRSPEPTDAERLHTYLARMTPGGMGGESRAIGPIMPRDLAHAVAIGGGSDDELDTTESKIDQFSVTGTGTTTFTLTYSPLDDSWNVSCGYPLDSGVDYTIDDQTLTILNPATTFIGASATYPKTLQVQYDYLGAVPVSPADYQPPAGFEDLTAYLVSYTATFTETNLATQFTTEDATVAFTIWSPRVYTTLEMFMELPVWRADTDVPYRTLVRARGHAQSVPEGFSTWTWTSATSGTGAFLTDVFDWEAPNYVTPDHAVTGGHGHFSFAVAPAVNYYGTATTHAQIETGSTEVAGEAVGLRPCSFWVCLGVPS